MHAMFVAAALMLPALACAQRTMDSGYTAEPRDIVTVAREAGSFNTLVAAIEAAGLVETLESSGPFTVFAPTDEAFAKLPAGTVEALLANPEQLRAVLTYHVVSGRVMAADVIAARSASPATVNGQVLTVQAVDGTVRVNGAKVVGADVDASNGVIHVIDTVLLPSAESSSR